MCVCVCLSFCLFVPGCMSVYTSVLVVCLFIHMVTMIHTELHGD